MISVVVSGAGGQLGRALQAARMGYPELNLVFLDRSDLDITNPAEIEAVIEKYKPEYFVNCAAYTHVEGAEEYSDKAMAINGLAVGKLADICSDRGIILIHISTDYVFDGENPEGYNISDRPNPINAYGRSKVAGEIAIKNRMEQFYIIRTSWLYSPVFGPNFYTIIRDKALRGEELRITDSQRGCPTRAENLAKYILELICSKDQNYGFRHFTDGKVMTWYDFAEDILSKEGLLFKAKLFRTDHYPTRAARPKNSILLMEDH